MIEAIYISPGHNYFGHHEKPAGTSPVETVPSAEVVEGRGIVGDRFFDYKDDYKGQVTFFQIEDYQRLCEKFGVTDKSPTAFRRNILTRDIDLPSLIGKEFTVGGVRFLGTQEAKPCYWMEQAFCEGAEEALKGHGGLRAKALTSGSLKTGDTISPL